MPSGFSQQNLTNKFQGKQLPGDTSVKFKKYAGNPKMPSDSVKGKMIASLKWKSEPTRKKIYQEWGLGPDQRTQMEKLVVGGKTPEQVRREKEIKAKRAKLNIYYTRRQRAAEEGSRGLANEITGKRARTTSRESKVDQAIARVKTVNGVKVGYGALGIEDSQRQSSKHFVGESATIRDQEASPVVSAGGRPTPVTGIGLGAQGGSPVTGRGGGSLHADFSRKGGLDGGNTPLRPGIPTIPFSGKK